VIYTIITKSVIGVAYFSVSSTISAVIGNAGLISQALYPKLLAKGSHDYITENFSRLMYFAIPLLGIAVIFSKPALFALNPAYEGVSIVVIIYSFRTFFYVITATLYQILMGIETVDVEKNYNYQTLRKSKLFLIPTLQNIQYGLYLVTLAFVLFIESNKMSQIELVTWWTVIALTIQIPFLIYAIILVQKQIKFSLSYFRITKYVAATIVFVIVFSFTSNMIIDYQISIYNFLPKVIFELFICLSIYLSITLAVDKGTRNFFKSIIGELTSK